MNYAALPEVPVDSDGVHRFYNRAIEIKEKEESAHVTFPWRIYELANPEEAKLKEMNIDDYYVRFAGEKQQAERLIIPASQIIDESNKENVDELKRFLKDKIVLIGGMFVDSRDKGMVPFGEIYGVEMHATIIETELHGLPQKPFPAPARIIINLLMILIFTINFSYYGICKKSVLIAAISMVSVGILLSVLQYGNSSGFLLLTAVFLYGLFFALFDYATDKYKEIFSSIFDEIKAYMPRWKAKNRRSK